MMDGQASFSMSRREHILGMLLVALTTTTTTTVFCHEEHDTTTSVLRYRHRPLTSEDKGAVLGSEHANTLVERGLTPSKALSSSYHQSKRRIPFMALSSSSTTPPYLESLQTYRREVIGRRLQKQQEGIDGSLAAVIDEDLSIDDATVMMFENEYRALQTGEPIPNGTRPCMLCNGAQVLWGVTPVSSYPDRLSPDFSCGDWWWWLSRNFVSEYSDPEGCAFFKKVFESQCCSETRELEIAVVDENGTSTLQVEEVNVHPYQCEQDIRSALLDDSYDPVVMPLSSGESALELEFFMNFYHITDLDVKSGSVEVFVWLQLEWIDPRLSWEDRDDLPSSCSSFAARASLDAEITELWVPDFDLYNQIEGVTFMPESLATVYRNGRVVWTRNGGLKALCFYTGLRQFPYDKLGCQFLLGVWTREETVKIKLTGDNGDGFNFLGDRAKYNEYRLLQELTETGSFEQFGDGAIYMNLYFQRSRRFYVTKIVIPAIIFTFLSFGVFLLDLRVGERLGYGLTVLLVITAQDIVISEYLPVTPQRLWINVLVDSSFYWVLVCNLESVLVLWLYFLGDYEFQELEAEEKMKQEKAEQAKSRSGADPPAASENENGPVEKFKADDDLRDHSDGIFAEGANSISAKSTKKIIEDAGANSSNGHKGPKKSGFFRRLIWRHHEMSRAERYQFIKHIDKYCFFIFPCAYIIFLIIMFSTNALSFWEDPPLSTTTV